MSLKFRLSHRLDEARKRLYFIMRGAFDSRVFVDGVIDVYARLDRVRAPIADALFPKDVRRVFAHESEALDWFATFPPNSRSVSCFPSSA